MNKINNTYPIKLWKRLYDGKAVGCRAVDRRRYLFTHITFEAELHMVESTWNLPDYIPKGKINIRNMTPEEFDEILLVETLKL